MKVQFVYREGDRIVERGFVYEVKAVEEGGWYQIEDDMGELCFYPPDMFDVIDPLPVPPVVDSTQFQCSCGYDIPEQ